MADSSNVPYTPETVLPEAVPEVATEAVPEVPDAIADTPEVSTESDTTVVSATGEATEPEYPRGTFSFVPNKFHRKMLEDAFRAVEKTNTWDYVKVDPGKGGFVWSQSPEVLEIFLAMNCKSHSIQTFKVVMRNMNSIAVNGWDAYVQEWINTLPK
jgi:hypothetical protein